MDSYGKISFPEHATYTKQTPVQWRPELGVNCVQSRTNIKEDAE